MTQEERWLARYNEVVKFIKTNKRNPSKYVDSERGLRNWVKQQKKLMNADALEGQRLKMFNGVRLEHSGRPMAHRPRPGVRLRDPGDEGGGV